MISVETIFFQNLLERVFNKHSNDTQVGILCTCGFLVVEISGPQKLNFLNFSVPKELTMYKQLYMTSFPKKPRTLQLMIPKICIVNIDKIYVGVDCFDIN